jgi:restriction system protein
MTVPDFQSLMLPILKIASDGQEHTSRELLQTLSEQLGLTENDKNQLLPSGRQRTFDNRVAWARVHMRMAGLLKNTGRGKFKITERGKSVIASDVATINLRYLRQFSEYLENRNPAQTVNHEAESTEEVRVTPEEALEASYQSLRVELARELLDKVKSCTPEFFERLVVDLLVAMGYGGSRRDAGQAVGQSGDGGVDGIIKEDRLGLDVVYIQAKRWGNKVGRPDVQAFAGSLEGQRARKGVFITTSQFTNDALDYVNRIEKKIVLINGEHLAQLMIDFGIGVAEVTQYSVKKVDLDYFDEE